MFVVTSHASKVILKIFQARLQQYLNWKFSDVQAGFSKGRRTRGQIVNIRWVMQTVREFQKKHMLLFHWLHKSCGSWGHKESDMTERLNWTELSKWTTEQHVIWIIFVNLYWHFQTTCSGLYSRWYYRQISLYINSKSLAPNPCFFPLVICLCWSLHFILQIPKSYWSLSSSSIK